MSQHNRNHDEIAGVLRQFDLAGDTTILTGGTQPIYRAGDAVLKHIEETSLENNHSRELIQWIAEFSATLPQEGFRVPKPIPTATGTWMTADGWTAWTFVQGRHATRADIPACIAAIQAFHRAIRAIPMHPRMRHNQTAWGKADRWCWGKKPEGIQPELCPLVNRLYALRQPVPGLTPQLIHADLNPTNLLIAPDLPPAILDISPFWGPPEFALAIFANFAGPRRGDPSVLDHFAGVREFDQLLVRAGIRMLLVVSALNGLDDWREERRAAEMIIERVAR
jgi:Phosphotransferase enzyme family